MKNIALLFGGTSGEHDISVISAQGVISAIRGHNVIPVYITREGKWLMYDGKPDHIDGIDWEKFGTPAILSPDRVNRGLLRIVNDKVKAIPVDLVFPMLHGPCGEDGTIQGLCEIAGIPYVGCGVLSSALCMDKAFTKLIAKHHKVPTGEYLVYKKEALANLEGLKAAKRAIGLKMRYPCFVKPATGGSSIGITRVENKKGLNAALELALQYSNKVIIEKAVKGREIELAVLGNGTNTRVSVAGEIIPDGVFYDYEAKYEKPASQTIIPADLPEKVSEKLQAYARTLFEAADGNGMARIDFFVTEDGGIFFNEINTLPGFTAISMYAKLWEHEGISRVALINELIECAE
ncbi:MAG: D-alanine--D-alanine ligase [Defluviitaleaceae bacterium]|nr:D-alanine--D-alanine ligase [Defluviitaleaceae bacterium]MCL2273551.1 D-alanine--D-alanine ligase [Defluviitaleaceae bacterium]